MQAKSDFIMSLSDASVGLSQVGGKGASLARMAAAGLPVPPGFHVTTAAYRRFVAEHRLQEQILAAVSAATPDQPATLEEASSRIGKLFAQSAMPDDIAEAIRRAYTELGGGDAPVAVRSSATAEDLPEMSFAGQQETYLNIRGAEAVLEAIKKCWASLWTARAIAYRARQGIAPDSVALAVVVQVLIQADAAGVLFTANPMSGSRDELVINANWGLGEALVSGQVSPDTLVVKKKNGRVLKATVAVKSLMTVTGAQGTHEDAVPEERRTERVLSNSEARQLASLARQIEGLYGSPQDVEWCRAEKKFYIVQSRPITRMPPDWPVPERDMFYGRSSLAEFLPGPLSPLFETFGLAAANDSSREMMLRLTQVAWKYDLYTAMNGFTYVVGPTRPRDLLFYVIMTVRLMRYMRRSGVAHWYEARDVLRSAAAAWEGRALAEMSPAELLAAARGLMKAATDYYGVVQSTAIPMSTMAETSFTQLYNRLIRRKEDPDASVLLVGGETDALRAEKSLFELYAWVRERPELAAWLGAVPAAEIVARLSSGSGPETLAPDDWQGWVERLRAHQRTWGHLLYDFDFASPLLCEDPLPAIEALKNHLAGRGIDPNLRQRRQLENRANLCAEISRRLDPLRRKWFNQSLDQAVARGPLREDAIAAMGLTYPALRRIFGDLGARLVRAGGLERAEDIYWLRAAELEETARRLEQNRPMVGISADVQAHKTAHQQRLTFSPPPVLPRDSFLRGLMPPEDTYQAEGNTLKGVGASGGSVTAPACVIFGAEDFARMRPGDVLVAVNTTPAWTPLFALASAVITDIGGPLSHSSIVAREYGIPAVMATGAATRRIRSGQTITVDGTKGEVILETTEGQAKQPTWSLEWKVPYPKPLLARASSIDLMPDAVSPLFATLGIPIATNVYLDMYDWVMGLRGEDVPIFEVINGYIFLCFIKGRKFWKYMLVHGSTVGRLYQYGKVRAEELRAKSHEVVTKWRQMDSASVKAPELLAGVRELFEISAGYLNVAVARPMPRANFSEFLFSRFYNALIKRKEDPVAMTFLLGLENLPLRAEKSLFDLAQWAKGQAEMADYLTRTPAEEVWAELQSDPVPAPLSGEFAARFAAHLAEFGHVIYDIDFMNPVPAEEPIPVLDALKVYLAGQGGNPHSRQQAQERQRQQAEQAISQRIGPLRRKWFQKLLTSAQECASERENAIADIGLPYPQLRRLLRELGLRLTAGGAIAQPEDIYWLEAGEVDALAAALEMDEPLSSHAASVEARKASWKRARKVTPPTVLPENSWLSKLVTRKKPGSNILKGYGACGGSVTAPACVLRGPEDFAQMRPGDVIVAVTTTPAWTPLFAMASAVVTDIGGPLSHSSIVAREYGIPAVMATGVATRRIQNGQMLTVNGTAGAVTLA